MAEQDYGGIPRQVIFKDKMIEKAKERISTTELSVNEISYELGFEHPQSFSRLLKPRPDFRLWLSGNL